MKTKQKQSGFSLISLILTTLFVGVTVLVAIRLFPVYFEHYKIVSTIESLTDDVKSKSPSEIVTSAMLRSALQRKFDINDIRNVAVNDLKLSRVNGDYKIQAKYDVRIYMIGNIDAVVRFNSIILVNASIDIRIEINRTD